MSIDGTAARRFALAAMLALGAPCGVAAINADVLAFPYAEGGYRSHPDDPAADNDWSGELGMDLFGTLNGGRFTSLAEVLITTEEQDVERLQFGWEMGQNTLWLGRFHNPVGYWNTECHHGAYLQSTIRRPGLAAFEDDSGLVPMHATGFLLQGSRSIGRRGLSYDLAVGLGPGYDSAAKSLDALNILRPGNGDHDYLGTVRLTYESEPAGNNRVGVFASAVNIPVADTASDQFKQRTIGIFAAGDISMVRLIAELQYVRTRLERSAEPGTASMAGGYVQFEYGLGADWDVYGRAEKLWEKAGPSYLELVPEATEAGLIGGIRYRFLGKNQLKLEIGKRQDPEDRHSEILLEWSAVVP